MFRLICSVTVGRWKFDKISSCEIELNSDTLTDTCRITLPKKVVWEGESDVPVKRGDKIKVQLGYDNSDSLVTRFDGYVVKVGTKAPLVLECEDTMWLLKRTYTEQRMWNNANLSEVLRDIVPAEIEVVCHNDICLGKYKIKQNMVSGVLDDLRRFGIKCYIKNSNGSPALHAALDIAEAQDRKWFFQEGMNIIDNQTEFRYAEEIKSLIEATAVGKDGSQIVVKVGDNDGEVKKIYRYNVTEEELRKIAEEELKRYKCDRLTGEITTFGVPEIDKGDTICIQCDDIQKSCYSVKLVKVSFGSGGYRQVLTLDKKV